MSKQLTESLNLAEATTGTDTETGVLEVEFITPGWGSSGYYSREVVEAAAPLFTVGTHMYFDHPTAEEDQARPVRSVKDLAAVIVEAGTVDPTTGGVRGKVRPLAVYAPLLTDKTFAENVGLSIRGSATDVVVGEAEGRRGPIIEGLATIASVDFVTRAGRGGRVLQVLESANPEVVHRAIERGVAEATVDERRVQLSDVVKGAYASADAEIYAWVRDFDESTVWFDVTDKSSRDRTWQQAYTVADDDLSVSLTGERINVRPVTKYVPVTRPGSNTTTESQEDTMPNIEESELAQLREASGRVDAAEQRATEAESRATVAEAALAQRDRTERARALIAEHADGVTFTPLETRGLLADLPLTQEGALDEAAFTKTVTESAAAAKAARGAGTVRGFGGSTGGTAEVVTESDIDNAVAGAFGRTIKGA